MLKQKGFDTPKKKNLRRAKNTHFSLKPYIRNVSCFIGFAGRQEGGIFVSKITTVLF